MIWFFLGQAFLQILVTFCSTKKLSVILSLLISLLVPLFIYLLKLESGFVTLLYLALTVSIFTLGFVCISGSYLHARKDGGADRRYNHNPFMHSFPERNRSFAIASLGYSSLTILIVFLLDKIISK